MAGDTREYVGRHQVAAAIRAFGTPAQQDRFLPAIDRGDEIWCQLFSEPGAGSDLAGLATLAMQDGDEWLVTGQKVWTSHAEIARWGLLLARTDPDAPKHRGLTLFVCDMQAPGVEVRPLRQADGAAHFSEVFLDGVRLSDGLRLGECGQGWAAALHAMHSERAGIGDALATPLQQVEDAWRARVSSSPARDVVLRDRVVRTWIDARLIELLRARMLAAGSHDKPIGSLLKLAQGSVNQRASSLAIDLLGPAGLVGFDYEANRRGEEPPPQMLVVRSRAHTIEGGSDEVQRNIIGEQVLGLTEDIRVDKGIPWREVPRS